MKKLAVVGRGTVGCMTAAHFLKHTDYAIDWIYDPEIIPAAVGEGTTLNFPRALQENLMFDSNDMITLNSTPKVGISKRNWGTSEKEFLQTYHFKYPNERLQIFRDKYKPLSRDLRGQIESYMKNDPFFIDRQYQNQKKRIQYSRTGGRSRRFGRNSLQ